MNRNTVLNNRVKATSIFFVPNFASTDGTGKGGIALIQTKVEGEGGPREIREGVNPNVTLAQENRGVHLKVRLRLF